MITDAQLEELTAGLQGLIIAMLDKLNQLEAHYQPFLYHAGTEERLAEVRAMRVMVREYLATLRTLNRKAGGMDGGVGAAPVHPHEGPARGPYRDRPTSHDIENSKNSYAKARE